MLPGHGVRNSASCYFKAMHFLCAMAFCATPCAAMVEPLLHARMHPSTHESARALPAPPRRCPHPSGPLPTLQLPPRRALVARWGLPAHVQRRQLVRKGSLWDKGTLVNDVR